LLRQGAASDSGARPRGTPFEPPPVAEIARLFPQLEGLELVGRGGMGAVYKARQPALDRLVALKVLRARPGADAGFAERFAREARALAKLSHPNIVAVHEFGQVEGLHYFIMEYVDGTTLRQMERAGRLSPRQALALIPALCDALQYAHDEGVVHRDIKPENVLVDRRGRVKIADFGLARILDLESGLGRLTGVGEVMGTPHYMAPEQIEHPLEVDHRADIYALGVVLYEMLTGELPLGRFPPPSRRVQVDVRLDEVVLRALEKEPERRYQHASEVRTAVETITQTPAPVPGSLPAAEIGTWVPFRPPLVRDLCAHLTESERRDVRKLGLLFGFWNAATFFVPVFVVLAVPGPVGWALGLGALLVGLSFYPLLLRLQRERLCSSAWARQQGITPAQVRDAMDSLWRKGLVEVRDGHWVIHWPAVLLVAVLVASMVMVALLALSGLGYLGASGAPLRLPVDPLVAFVGVLLLTPFAALWLRAHPLARPRWPDAPPRGIATAPPVTEELLCQVRQPAVGLFVVGVANWVLIPLIVMPFAWYGLSWRGLPPLDPALGVGLLLAPFVLSGVVFVAALRMMRLQSYGLAIAAAILAMIVTPGNLVGFPIGIWALVVLLRPEVRAAFDAGRPPPSLASGPSGGHNTGTRRALIVIAIAVIAMGFLGVLLAGGAALLWWRMRADAVVRARAEEAAAIQNQQAVLARMAERQRAAPRNAVGAVHCTDRKAVIDYSVDADHELFLFVGSGYPGWSAGQGPGPARATVEASDQVRLDDGSMGRGFVFVAGGVRTAVAITEGGPVPFGDLVFRPEGAITGQAGTFTFADLRQADGPLVPLSVGVRWGRRFGPVAEKTVATTDADGQGLVFLDLETGQTARPPFALTLHPAHGPAFVDLTPELLEWVRAQGMDLLLRLGDKGWDQMTLEMQQDFAGQFGEWETVTPAQVAGIFARKDAKGQVRDLVPASSFGHAYRDGLGPVTAFRTRRDTLGIYQVEGIENDTRKGVGFRYRLVQSAAASAPAPAAGFAKPARTSKPGLFAPGAPASVLVGAREVNRKVAGFPAAVDLSTPEAACAAFHRAGAREDVRAWVELSWTAVDVAETEAQFRRERQADPEGTAVYLKAVADARIVEVLNWGADLAQTITWLPFPPGKGNNPFSARTFARINGQWKNVGEDRLPSLEAARANFEQKKEALWQQYQDLAEGQAGAVSPPEAP